MSTPLVDPAQAAFFAADPANFPPAPPPPAEQPNHAREELALAIAVALVVAAKVIRPHLAARHEGADGAGDAAREAWSWHALSFENAIRPAVRALLSGTGLGTDPATAAVVADAYVTGLGDYMGASSADAVQAGLMMQLSTGINDTIAWQRVAAGYGLDLRGMRGLLLRLGTTANPDQLLPAPARVYIDKATLIRADLLGRSEAWTALETGKALAWQAEQRAGLLPRDAMREWDTAEDEATCPTCAPMDRTAVPLDEPFDVAGRKLWAPQAHPGCRCRVKLRRPEISKNNPYHDAEGEFTIRPKARPKARVKERTVLDPEIAAILRDVVDAPEVEVAPKLPSVEPILPSAEGLPTVTPLPQMSAGLPTASRLPGASVLPGASALPSDPSRLPGTRFSTAEQARDAHRTEQHRVVRHIVFLGDSTVAPDVPRAERYAPYLDTESYNRLAMVNIGQEYQRHEVVDFSVAQANSIRPFEARMPDAWMALELEPRYFKRRMDPGVDRDATFEAWDTVKPLAKKTFDVALKRPEMPLRELRQRPDELREIAELGGLTADQARHLSATEISHAIMGDIPRLDRGEDGSLAQAYGDWVTWRHPRWFGEVGRKLGDHLDDVREGAFYQINIVDAPVDQVFYFDTVRDSDLTPDGVVPHGDYVVVKRTYESALHRKGLDAPPLHMGLSILHLAPFQKNWGRMPNGVWLPDGVTRLGVGPE